MTFHDRDPPPRMIRSRVMTRASIQTGTSAGSPNAVTPPICIPVSSAVTSAGANDALRVPSRSRTARFTSSRYGASVTHAAYRGGSDLPMTTIVFAESSGENPYAAQNAAVSARAGSQANSWYGTPSGSRCSISQARPAGSWSSIALAYDADGYHRGP